MGRLFGTSGIRGSVEELFTNQFCFDLGRTFAIFLDKHNQSGKIAVGMDPRSSSQRIKEYFSAGLATEKRDVFDEGITPVPSMNWLLMKSSDFIASAMITGSHIEADLNGIKFFALKDEILKEHEKEIGEVYESIKETIPHPAIATIIPKDEKAIVLYKEMLLDLADKPYSSLRIVVDTGNGAQTAIMSHVLKDLGVDVVPTNNDYCDQVLARDTEVEAHFESLKTKVLEEKADLGVGYDMDGDRVIFVDKNGKFIPGEYSSTILAKYEDTGKIVVTFNVSQIAEQIGKEVIRTKVGSPFVVEEMKRSGADFGFEANGGGIFGKIMFSRDGGSTTIKMLNLMKRENKSLDQLIAELPKFYVFKDKVDCPWEKDERINEAVKKKYQGMKIEELDGIKVWPGLTSWILFRSSQNAPEFRVFAEAKTQEEASKLGQDGIELVKEVIKNG
ncbi:MAG: hypothetical protein Q8P91_01705 [bacterium]|nr:hypothetical protein [bacterium]